MVSCPKATYDRVEPILKHFGKLFYTGDKPGTAQTAKLANNLMAAAALVITSEAVAMGVKGGVNAKVLIDIINASSGRNSASEDKFPRAVLPGTFDFGFTTGLSYKDVRLCVDEAEAMGVPMVCGSVVRQMLAITNAKYGASSDFTSIAQGAGGVGRRGNARLDRPVEQGAPAMAVGSNRPGEVSLARQLARAALAVDLGPFDADVIAKAKICLLDFLSCAFEARNHPWSRQAIGIAREIADGATIVGTDNARHARRRGLRQRDAGPRAGARGHARRQHLPPWRGDLADAARPVGANAAVRRDPARGSDRRLRGRRPDRPRPLQRRSGPPLSADRPCGAAWRGARGKLRARSRRGRRDQRCRIAANTSSGLNEWPHAGGSEMYFHPGFAARNAITAIELAEAGAYASETILEGEAGLFAAFRRAAGPATPSGCSQARNRKSWPSTTSRRPPAILRRLPHRRRCASARETRRPGGDRKRSRSAFPKRRRAIPAAIPRDLSSNALQAKMSIPFSVAAVLARGAIEEDNYADDRRIPGFSASSSGPICRRDPAFTAAFPAQAGRRSSRSACATGRRSDSASTTSLPQRRTEIRARFRQAAAGAIGDRARAASGRTRRRSARRFRTVASSRPGAGSNRRSSGCGRHHDRERRTKMGGCNVKPGSTAADQPTRNRTAARREVSGDRRRWKDFCRRCPPGC